MKTIHRYQLDVTDVQHLQMPAGAIPLRVAAGTSRWPVIDTWYFVDTEAPRVQREFRVVGTGNPTDADPSCYIGSAVHELAGGRGVWHVFDLGEK